MPITRTAGRGGCRATLHKETDPADTRVLVSLEARAATMNPGGPTGLHVVVHLEPGAVRELAVTLREFLSGDPEA